MIQLSYRLYKDLNKAELKLYLYLLIHYKVNTDVLINKELKDTIIAETDLALGTIDNTLMSLVKKGFLILLSRSVYKIVQ